MNSKMKLVGLGVTGIFLGYILGQLSKAIVMMFVYGYFSFLYAGPGEFSFADISSLVISYLNYAAFSILLISYTIIGIFIGKQLYKNQITIVRSVPFLLFLALFVSWVGSNCIATTHGKWICGISVFRDQLFVLSSTIGFIVLLISSEISLLFHKKASNIK